MRRSVLVASLCVLLIRTRSGGDCGSIPFDPGPAARGIKIFEPNQRALIAWNGVEEILILSTDLRASKPTKVLEVIPLPSKPAVKKGDVKVFEEATWLINSKLDDGRRGDRSEGTFGAEGKGGFGPPAPPPPAGVVAFHEKIGATDVSVTQVLRKDGFVAWVEKYLKSRSVKRPKIPEPMKKVVQEYLDDGCTWFVFNVVALDTTTKTKQAIEYRFISPCIYYPLRITRTETGDTTVRLLVLTEELVSKKAFSGIPHWRVKVLHKPVDVSAAELRDLHKESHELLNKPKSVKLRIWQIKGKLSGFKQDLVVARRRLFYLRRHQTGRVHGPFAFRDGAAIKLGSHSFTLEGGGERPYFILRHQKTRAGYGTFRFQEGQRVKVVGTTYILLTNKPPSPDA